MAVSTHWGVRCPRYIETKNRKQHMKLCHLSFLQSTKSQFYLYIPSGKKIPQNTVTSCNPAKSCTETALYWTTTKNPYHRSSKEEKGSMISHEELNQLNRNSRVCLTKIHRIGGVGEKKNQINREGKEKGQGCHTWLCLVSCITSHLLCCSFRSLVQDQ